jgi:hypothetical protein
MSKYISFISYRHKKEDTETARLLRKGIENTHLPKELKSDGRRRVFRDTDELPTSSDLSRDIENALDDSDYLIAVCSEDYVKSKWCLKEIDMYIASGRKDRILPVLLSGTPETSIPESIRDLPLASDLRDDLEKGGSLRKAVDRDLPGILSKMLDAPEDIIRKSERRFRIQAALAVFSVIFLILTGFGIYAIHTANRINELNEQIAQATVQAQEAQALALEERNVALLKKAQFLSKQAWVAIDEGRFDDAIRLGLEALPEDLNGDEPVSDEALAVLRTAMAMSIRLPYVKSAEFDLPITIGKVWDTPKDRAIIETDDGEFYYLSYADGSLEPYEGVYNWKSYYDYRNELLSDAKAEGYTGFVYKAVGVPELYCFYGNGLPMKCIARYSDDEFFYTVNGEPFYATNAFNINTSMVAWCEYEDDEKPCAALFDMGSPEAIAILPVHNVVSVTFGDSTDSRGIFVTDDTGTIYSFNRESAELITSVEGSYTDIEFIYRDAPRILAVTDEGKSRLLDTVNLEPLYEISTTSSINSVFQCKARNMLMALCSDGVRLYSIGSGDYLMNVVEDDAIISACWEGFAPNSSGFDGSKIIVFYPDRMDVYQPGRDDDKTGVNAIALCDNSVITTQSRPFYSNDGRSIYLEYRGTISKWDTETGELLWVNEPDTAFYGGTFDSVITSDGKYIWRSLWLNNGIEKIDTDTGEILFSQVYMTDHSDLRSAPIDSLDLNKAMLVTSEYSHKIIVIDSVSGESLCVIDSLGMIRKGNGSPAFSKDGNEVYCVKTYADPDLDEYRSIYELCAYDSESGELVRSHVVEDLEKIILVPEKELALAFRKNENTTDGYHYEILRIELSDFTEYGAVSFPYEGEPLFSKSYRGEMILSWTDMSDEQSAVRMACIFNRDGSFGNPVVEDSFEGRRLFLSSGNITNIFGYDAYITADGIQRLEDGLLLFGSTRDALNGLSGNGMSFITAPDGSSICIYSSGMTEEVTPFLIHPLTSEELVETARERLEMIGG